MPVYSMIGLFDKLFFYTCPYFEKVTLAGNQLEHFAITLPNSELAFLCRAYPETIKIAILKWTAEGSLAMSGGEALVQTSAWAHPVSYQFIATVSFGFF